MLDKDQVAIRLIDKIWNIPMNEIEEMKKSYDKLAEIKAEEILEDELEEEQLFVLDFNLTNREIHSGFKTKEEFAKELMKYVKIPKLHSDSERYSFWMVEHCYENGYDEKYIDQIEGAIYNMKPMSFISYVGKCTKIKKDDIKKLNNKCNYIMNSVDEINKIFDDEFI